MPSSRRDQVTTDCEVVVDARHHRVEVVSRETRLLRLQFDFEACLEHYTLHFPNGTENDGRGRVSIDAPPNASTPVCDFDPLRHAADDADEEQVVYQVTALVAGDAPGVFGPTEALPVGAVQSSKNVDVGDGGALVLEIAELVGGGHRFGLTINAVAAGTSAPGTTLELSIEGSNNLSWGGLGPHAFPHALDDRRVVVPLIAAPASFIIGDARHVEAGLPTELRYATSFGTTDASHGQDHSAVAAPPMSRRNDVPPQASEQHRRLSPVLSEGVPDVPTIFVTAVEDDAPPSCGGVQPSPDTQQEEIAAGTRNDGAASEEDEAAIRAPSLPSSVPEVTEVAVTAINGTAEGAPTEISPHVPTPSDSRSHGEPACDALPQDGDLAVEATIEGGIVAEDACGARTIETTDLTAAAALVPEALGTVTDASVPPAVGAEVVELAADADADPLPPQDVADGRDCHSHSTTAASSATSIVCTVAPSSAECLADEGSERGKIASAERLEWKQVLVVFASAVCALCHQPLLKHGEPPIATQWRTADDDIVSLAVHPQCAARAPVCAACNVMIVGAYVVLVADADAIVNGHRDVGLKEVPYHIACAQGMHATTT